MISLSEAIFVFINYLLIFHMHLHSSHEDLLCDLADQLGETDQPVVCMVFLFLLFFFLPFSVFLSVGTSPVYHYFYNMIDSALAT